MHFELSGKLLAMADWYTLDGVYLLTGYIPGGEYHSFSGDRGLLRIKGLYLQRSALREQKRCVSICLCESFPILPKILILWLLEM